jgi:nucleoside recognition membrane protein YjiH
MNFEDGFWDLLLGCIFMMLALYPVTRELLGPVWNLVLFLIVLALLVAVELLLRRYVSGPRIGYAQPRRSPKLRLVLAFTILMVLITFGLVLVTLLSPESVPSAPVEASAGRSYLVELIVVLFMGGLFSALGYLYGVTRLYFYGWMLGLANLASVYMVHNAGWTVLIPLAMAAGIILLIGLVLLVRFLRKYPVRAEAD